MIDLRSDTVTRPDDRMRAVMAQAPVGDDVYEEDPSVTELEETVAAALGHEAGLFCASGSLANMLGIAVSAAPGTEVLCEAQSHIVRAEGGSHAALAGVTTRTWVSPDGTLDAEAALSLVSRAKGYIQVGTSAISIENTHNFGGGRIAALEQMRHLRARTQDLGVLVHLDGARLVNASVATGIDLATYGRCADTVSLCLSKGLGAPVGSVLVSSHERIARARALRKRYGGGMRQAGIVAAGALYAFRTNVVRLAEDHANAQVLARALAEVAPGSVDPALVETNIVYLDTSATGIPAERLAAEAARRDILFSAMDESHVRLVTHLDVSAEQAAEAAAGLVSIVRELGRPVG